MMPRDRALWQAVRRALLMIVKAIETYLGDEKQAA